MSQNGWSRLRNNLERHRRCFELLTNSLLFASSIILLLDLAPHDLWPSYAERVRAVSELKKARNILGESPHGWNIRLENPDTPITRDRESFSILADFIRGRSFLVADVEWGDVLGVGYSTVSLPVAGNKLEAFRPLYLVLVPAEGESRLILHPVGLLEDLDRWLQDWRQTFLTRTAVSLLALGFFLQLAGSFLFGNKAGTAG